MRLQANLKGGCSKHPTTTDDDAPFTPHVVLPMSNVHVVSAVDLKNDHLSRRQIPLAVKEPPSTSSVTPFHLPLRRCQTEPSTDSGNVELTERVRAPSYVA